jgi:hypothetical protein
MQKHVLIFFLDGVGLGPDDAATNPFVTAHMPHLTALLGERWYVTRTEPIVTSRATLAPTDANLEMAGRPQSATGQAALLTGRNVPQEIGRHWGPWPNDRVDDLLAQGTMFSRVREAGLRAALLNPYPPQYHEAVARGRRLYSSVVLSAVKAGLDLRTPEDLRAGTALSPGFTNEGWRNDLGYGDMPLLTLAEAGARLARLAREHDLSFLDHWMTDIIGHREPLDVAARHLEQIDAVAGALLEAWDEENGLLIITSDHGNIEAKDKRSHTRNPVPTIVAGVDHRRYAARIRTLTDIAPVVYDFLGVRP